MDFIDKVDILYVARAQVERWTLAELKENTDLPAAAKELENRRKNIRWLEYYDRNKEVIKENARKSRKENKEKLKAQRKGWYKKRCLKDNKIKEVVLKHYGKGELLCVKCGFKDIRALTLDHIVSLRGTKRKCSGVQFYKVLKKQEYPEGFQTLCANCQMIKMFEENEWSTKS